MDKFLQAKLEAGQMEAAGHEEEPTKEPHQKRSRGAAAKHTRSQSTDAGMSQKKIWREHVAEAPSKRTSTSRVEPDPTHACSKDGVSLSIIDVLTSLQAPVK